MIVMLDNLYYFFIQQGSVTPHFPCYRTTMVVWYCYLWAVSGGRDRIGYVANLYKSLGKANKPYEPQFVHL